MNEPIRIRIDEGDSVLADREHFRMAHLVALAVGKPDLEGLERLSIQPLPKCFRVHCLSPEEAGS